MRAELPRAGCRFHTCSPNDEDLGRLCDILAGQKVMVCLYGPEFLFFLLVFVLCQYSSLVGCSKSVGGLSEVPGYPALAWCICSCPS